MRPPARTLPYGTFEYTLRGLPQQRHDNPLVDLGIDIINEPRGGGEVWLIKKIRPGPVMVQNAENVRLRRERAQQLREGDRIMAVDSVRGTRFMLSAIRLRQGWRPTAPTPMRQTFRQCSHGVAWRPAARWLRAAWARGATAPSLPSRTARLGQCWTHWTQRRLNSTRATPQVRRCPRGRMHFPASNSCDRRGVRGSVPK